MQKFEEYLSQDRGYDYSNHYDEHTDRWVDEASESIYGHSGHADIHTDNSK